MESIIQRVVIGRAERGKRYCLRRGVLPCMAMALTVVGIGCSKDGSANAAGAEAPRASIKIETGTAVERPITRFIRASGTLMAQDSAEVAAETAGRIVATPVERGIKVRAGDALVRIAATEAEAQALEAEANVAQVRARLGQPDGGNLEVDRVPEVASAKATYELAQADFARFRTLYDQKLVARSEFDLRQAQVETTRRQYETARNNAMQQNQALAAAVARATLAQKALADTVVRAPFDGVVSERLVSMGDYVTRGTKVASVMRVNPLRVELTVPAQLIAAVSVDRSVSFSIDAYPGQTFEGRVRYVAPGVRTDSRALVVEAVVPNDKGLLKPGLFATAQIEEASQRPGVLVPWAAVRTVAGTTRVFVVSAGHVNESIISLGQRVGEFVEVTMGLDAGAVVAISNVNQLTDGAPVVAAAPPGGEN